VPQLRAPYEDAAEFPGRHPAGAPDHTGLKEGIDEDGASIVEVFRNCACGSTLLETFSDRRDQSPGGCGGASASARCSTSWWRTASNTPARDELLKLMRGQPHDLIGLIRSTKAGPDD
jgi:hypothetical protein